MMNERTLDLLEILREFPDTTINVRVGGLAHFARQLLDEAMQESQHKRAVDILDKGDTKQLARYVIAEIDYEQFLERFDDIYDYIPLLLTQEDYRVIDSLLTHSYVEEQIREDRAMLMLPTCISLPYLIMGCPDFLLSLQLDCGEPHVRLEKGIRCESGTVPAAVT